MPTSIDVHRSIAMAIDIVIIVIVIVIVIVARTKATPAAIVDQARVEPAPATLLIDITATKPNS